MVKALKNYEDMLQGAKAKVITDHKPLLPSLQAAYKAPSARLRRWALAITDFNVDINKKMGQLPRSPIAPEKSGRLNVYRDIRVLSYIFYPK